MKQLEYLFQSKNKGATGRAGLLQVPLTESQKDIIAPAIADLAKATANTKSGIMLQFLRDGAIGAGEYEAACIEGVYYDTQHREESDPYPRKYGIVRGYESYIENLLSHTNPLKTAFACEKADYLLRPVLQRFTALAKREDLRLHEPIDSSDPRVNLEAHYAKAVFEDIESKGGFVSPNAKAAAIREGTPPASELIDVVLGNWVICREMGDQLLKYLFYAIGATQNWDECLTDRLQFADACREAYRYREATERAEREQMALLESTDLMRMEMAGGDYVLTPPRYVALNPEDAASCRYAGVIEVANAPYPFPPSFLFFTADPVTSMTTDEKSSVLDRAERMWSNGSLEPYRQLEVKLELDKSGDPVNLEDYILQPRVVIRAVGEKRLSDRDAYIVRAGE